jgi:hypothetical protein
LESGNGRAERFHLRVVVVVIVDSSTITV